MGIHRSLWAGEEKQKGNVLRRTGGFERLVGGALVYWW